MANNQGPVYEVTLSVDPEVIEEFDTWLVEHVNEMLEIPGFISASVFAADGDEDGRIKRVTQYRLENDADLENYLAGPAASMRQSAADLFAGRYSASRRVLRNTDVVHRSFKPPENCLNCKAALAGQYCGNCGQRAQTRLISIWELIRDAFGDLFELDSRVWRTLVPLVARPGQLTRDYLEGRRVRFMPPFRTYLVLSIFFFLVAFFDPRQELGILFEPAAVESENAAATGADNAAVRQQVLQELADEGLIDATQAGIQDDTGIPAPVDAEGDAAKADDEDGGLTITFDDEDVDASCKVENFDETELPLWLARRLSKERLVAICERIAADDGRAFWGKLLDNVPAALFILLPLMALVLKLLYPLSKRYYVEHLLFIVHFHAFFFLILILQILFTRLVAALSLPEIIASVTVFAVSLYIPLYLYKAMRRVYEQGHLATLTKYLVLLAAYFMGISFIFLFAAVFAAFSI